MNKNYNRTIYSCFAAYIVQAIVNNFVPLLFVTFRSEFNIPLSKITLLITLNFLIQLCVDLCSVKFVDKIGYRASAILAHILATVGLASLAFLPNIMPDPFIGLLISVFFYAIGGGLLEVIISPIVESCPTDNKEMAMSLLHSFYCWGQLAVVLISTAFFQFIGISNWRIMAIIWAIFPLANMFSFFTCPLAPILPEGEEGKSLKELLTDKIFWVVVVLMACAGASEQAVSQWASTFAETSLGITKTLGDLLGPAFFALLMAISRTIYGKFGEKMNLTKFMIGSGVLCVISYLMICLVPVPMVNLIGCGITGFAVGIFWPGTFSKASASIRGGGTAMFALLALAGDVGCSGGPTLVGMVSSAFGDNLSAGIGFGIIFPVLMILGLVALEKIPSKKN